MPTIKFGSLNSANNFRDKVSQYVDMQDDRRTTTVKLQGSTPDNLIERARDKADQSRQERTQESAGQVELGEGEKKTLKKTTGFNWQKHGFEAMRVKSAMQAEGVTEWQDFYEPGEGVASARSKLRNKKSSAGRTSIGVGGERTDQEEIGNNQRRTAQSERVDAQAKKKAKEPAILEQDSDAQEFLETERMVGGDVFDITVGQGQSASGRDMELLEERNEQRSEHARLIDDLQGAPTTDNPIEWANNPAHFDFPGVDTKDPETYHEHSRTPQAQAVDERERAPIADNVNEWFANPDELDWPGVDTPPEEQGEQDIMGHKPSSSRLSEDAFQGLASDQEATEAFTRAESERGNAPMEDTRARQDTLGFAADATQHRESQTQAEQNTGGLLEDTRNDPDRGAENDVAESTQDTFGF